MVESQPKAPMKISRATWFWIAGIVIYLFTIALVLARPLNPWPQGHPTVGDIFACLLGSLLNPLLAFVFIVYLATQPEPQREPEQASVANQPGKSVDERNPREARS